MSDQSARPRVFVVHEPLKKILDDSELGYHWERLRDLTPAREYGDLIYIFPAGHISYDKDYLYRTAQVALATFTSQDFILMSGDTLAMAQTAIVASQLIDDDARDLNVLIWDGKRKRYFCQPIWAWPLEEAGSDETSVSASRGNDVVDLTRGS